MLLPLRHAGILPARPAIDKPGAVMATLRLHRENAMYIHVVAGQPAALEDPQNFRDFKVVIEAPGPDAVDFRTALAPVGRIEDDKYVWVRPDWLRGATPLGSEAEWQAGLQKMTAFAEKNGWVDQDGAIRAHIEWAGT